MRKLSASISQPVSRVHGRVARGLDAGNERSKERTTAMTSVRSLTTGWVASSRITRDIEPVAIFSTVRNRPENSVREFGACRPRAEPPGGPVQEPGSRFDARHPPQCSVSDLFRRLPFPVGPGRSNLVKLEGCRP